jgi:hypothetical protein
MSSRDSKGESAMKTREELIHAEMQSLRATGFQVIQWGVTLLVITELALAMIRRRGIEGLIAARELSVGQWLPLERHLLGTILLAVIAGIFAVMATVESRRFRFYSNLLRSDRETAPAIPEDVSRTELLIIAGFAAFPIIDLLLWPYLRLFAAAQ